MPRYLFIAVPLLLLLREPDRKRDAWADLHPTDPGFTAYQVTSSINNPVSTLWKRIDYVMVRGALAAESIELVGATPDTRTASGLWPSDHAGLVASIGHLRGN